jgi:hypothetical protein
VTSLIRARKQERRPWHVAEAAFGRRVAWSYFPILYVRSPAAFLDDSIVSSPLLPGMLTKPRTVCGCLSFANIPSEHNILLFSAIDGSEKSRWLGANGMKQC